MSGECWVKDLWTQKCEGKITNVTRLCDLCVDD